MKTIFIINKERSSTVVNYILIACILLAAFSCSSSRGVRERNKSIEQWEKKYYSKKMEESFKSISFNNHEKNNGINRHAAHY